MLPFRQILAVLLPMMLNVAQLLVVPQVALRFSAAVLVATGICRHGLKRHSLSPSGAVAAFCSGVVHMTSGWTFGMVLICFFATSTKLTKFRQEQKARLDAHIKPGGQRNALQVLCNSLPGSLAALVAYTTTYTSILEGQSRDALQLAAWCAFLGHYSCCCADTWASELGMLSRSQPRLITQPARPVPAGVNGGVTCLGLAASAAGGLCTGAALAACGWVTGEATPLSGLVSKALQQHGLLPGPAQSLLAAEAQQAVFWLVLSLVCGLVGSVVDSLLGATLQFSGYDASTGKVVAQPGDNVKHISGWAWLSNDAVNLSSALLTSMAAAGLGVYLTTRHVA